MKHYAEVWGKWWCEAKSQQTFAADDFGEALKPDNKLTGDQIRKAARSFKLQTARPCGLHPRHFGMLSEELTDVIARQWSVWEEYGCWPTQEQGLAVTLIPKADGGLRPIALVRATYRVCARIRVDAIKDWLSAIDSEVINNSAGKRCFMCSMENFGEI